MEKVNYITKKLLKAAGLGCPFCGSVDDLWIFPGESIYKELIDEHGHAVTSIECTKCDAALKQHSEGAEPYSAVLEKLWDKWCIRGGEGANDDE